MRSALIALILAAPAAAQPSPAKLPEGWEVARDVAYAAKSDRQKIDVYYPKEAKEPLPLLVQIHAAAGRAARRRRCRSP
jgi:hypothetical protein